MTFQDLILKLSAFWASHGCLLQQPLDLEVGAGTSHPETLFRVLGPKPWSVAYVQPSRRPDDGRFGQNPNRLFKHHQYQVILKPSPDEVQQLYLDSLEACGINPRQHDIRFEEDNWESPTLGAWGIGWQVMLDGLEITQFTYFQQVGGIDLAPISCEITYGLERIAMFLQRVDNVFDLEWGGGVKYGEVRLQEEIEQSKYAFGQVDMPAEAVRGAASRPVRPVLRASPSSCSPQGSIWPALEHCLKCSHLFNILDSSGSIGVTERTAYILRVRQLAVRIAQGVRRGDPAGAGGRRVAHGSRAADRDRLRGDSGELAAGPDRADGAAPRRAPEGVPADAGRRRPRAYSTPRRLTARVAKLAERQTDFEELVTGPPVVGGVQPDGDADAGGHRVSPRSTASRSRRSSGSETPKGAYLAYRVQQRGKADRRRAGRRAWAACCAT